MTKEETEQWGKDLERLEKLKPFLEKEGYKHLKVIPGRGICGIMPFIYTIGLCYGIDDWSYKGRYCYPREYAEDALCAIIAWDGKGDAPNRWIKHKAPNGDFWREPENNIE